jgi:hypothetical protein
VVAVGCRCKQRRPQGEDAEARPALQPSDSDVGGRRWGMVGDHAPDLSDPTGVPAPTVPQRIERKVVGLLGTAPKFGDSAAIPCRLVHPMRNDSLACFQEPNGLPGAEQLP